MIMSQPASWIYERERERERERLSHLSNKLIATYLNGPCSFHHVDELGHHRPPVRRGEDKDICEMWQLVEILQAKDASKWSPQRPHPGQHCVAFFRPIAAQSTGCVCRHHCQSCMRRNVFAGQVICACRFFCRPCQSRTCPVVDSEV